MAACTLAGALLGALASIATTQMHLTSEKTKMQIQAIVSDRKVYQEKAERLFGETSDLISFFDANNRFEVKEAKVRIGKVRRAAFEFAIYSSPEMALKTVGTVEAVNAAVSASDSRQLVAVLQELQRTLNELVASFYQERQTFERDHAKLLK
jgi:hypothetical protein